MLDRDIMAEVIHVARQKWTGGSDAEFDLHLADAVLEEVAGDAQDMTIWLAKTNADRDRLRKHIEAAKAALDETDEGVGRFGLVLPVDREFVAMVLRQWTADSEATQRVLRYLGSDD